MTIGETVEKLRVVPECQVAAYFRLGWLVAKPALRREMHVLKLRKVGILANQGAGPLPALLRHSPKVSLRPKTVVGGRRGKRRT